MFFRPILNPNGPDKLTEDLAWLADKLGVPVKNVRQWWYNDSIPGGWYKRVAATGIISVSGLADAGDARDIAAAADRAKRSDGQGAAA